MLCERWRKVERPLKVILLLPMDILVRFVIVCHNYICFVLVIVIVVSCRWSSTCKGERKASGYLARLGTRPLLCEVSNSECITKLGRKSITMPNSKSITTRLKNSPFLDLCCGEWDERERRWGERTRSSGGGSRAGSTRIPGGRKGNLYSLY